MEYDNVEYSKVSEKISKTPWNREHWIITPVYWGKWKGPRTRSENANPTIMAYYHCYIIGDNLYNSTISYGRKWIMDTWNKNNNNIKCISYGSH